EQLNKMYERNKVQITHSYLDLKIEELRLAAEYELQKQEEKELLREQRAKEKEDKKLQAEIANKRKQLEKDRKHFKQMLTNVEKLLKTANPNEIDKLKTQLSEYQDKLSELDKIEEDIDYREGHATAGYVYIISNIGAFGEDVYKIGVTRRLEPMDRIRELGSASVPFQFDVHALIFSEEAFALESELHNKFAKYKVNKINGRKEYFKVPFAEIKEVLDSHKELAIELTEAAEAFEYRQSLLLEK
ncbi:GIY-YIG nuclease family protein, partial [Streptococcus orisratti]|uniref:GIY-YIG nuclease family protein n=1 Tax=Streptococcus orisratti TaxID=114652 RepID=UPI002942E57D